MVVSCCDVQIYVRFGGMWIHFGNRSTFPQNFFFLFFLFFLGTEIYVRFGGMWIHFGNRSTFPQNFFFLFFIFFGDNSRSASLRDLSRTQHSEQQLTQQLRQEFVGV